MFANGGYGDGYGGPVDYNGASLFGGALGLGGSYTEAMGTPVHAAIATKRTFEVKPIMLETQPAVPSVVDVQPSEQPVQVCGPVPV